MPFSPVKADEVVIHKKRDPCTNFGGEPLTKRRRRPGEPLRPRDITAKTASTAPPQAAAPPPAAAQPPADPMDAEVLPMDVAIIPVGTTAHTMVQPADPTPAAGADVEEPMDVDPIAAGSSDVVGTSTAPNYFAKLPTSAFPPELKKEFLKLYMQGECKYHCFAISNVYSYFHAFSLYAFFYWPRITQFVTVALRVRQISGTFEIA